MADNQTNTSDASAPKTKPPTARTQGKAPTEVTETVVIQTNAFDPTKATLVDEAESLFKSNVQEAYGDANLSGVELVKVNHRVGHHAEYVFRGRLS